MSLLGLMRHMAEAERTQFRRRFAGLDVPKLYRSGEEPDGDLDGAIADQEVVNDAWAAWRAEVASPNSSPAIRTSASSDETAPVGRFRCANCWFT